MPLALDHLVLAARTLDEGVAWCEATLGVTPGPGGRHALMGTHNRLFSITTAGFARAYAEIIAIDPQAPPPHRPRWFDLDQGWLQAALSQAPQLVHWAARAPDTPAQLSALARQGFDGGELLPFERDTPNGRLHWRLSVHPDGQRLCGGAIPAWIEWRGAHPCDTLPASGVELRSLGLSSLPQQVLPAMPLPADIHVDPAPGAPALRATLDSPRGRVVLSSHPA